MSTMQADQDAIMQEIHQILQQIQATFAFMPDNPQEAEQQCRSWLQIQLNIFLDCLTHEDINISELMAVVGSLGPAFSRLPPERQPTLPQRFPGLHDSLPPELRVVV